MAEGPLARDVTEPPPGGNPGSTDELFAELERERRAALTSYWLTVLKLLASLPLLAAPLGAALWLGVDPPLFGADGELRAALRAWLTPRASWVIVALCAWIAIWGAWALSLWRRSAIGPKYRYLHDYKSRAFGWFCRSHFPGITYDPSGGIPWRVLDDSGLFPFACDVYSSEDRFSGRVGLTDVLFAEATAQREVRRGWGENRETVRETYFRGIILSADFPKHFSSTTRLVPKGAEVRPELGQVPANLEDPNFAALFDTWTTDQVDVRYILSPSLMERLTGLGRRYGGRRARFHEEQLLLLLPTARDQFEPSVYAVSRDRGQLDAFVADVRACLAVVDALNLNTRIWSKD